MLKFTFEWNLDLIESIDVKFTGMSGAIALPTETDIVGMFLKRGCSIG